MLCLSVCVVVVVVSWDTTDSVPHTCYHCGWGWVEISFSLYENSTDLSEFYSFLSWILATLVSLFEPRIRSSSGVCLQCI